MTSEMPPDPTTNTRSTPAQDHWQALIAQELEQLCRAPFFVLNPDALIGVRDELRRIRAAPLLHPAF
jgi:hypothetical protein